MMRTGHGLTLQGFLVATLVVAVAIVASPLADSLGFPLTGVLTGAVGLLAQALPFLLIGVLVSGLIAAFVSEDFIARHFPRNPLAGMVACLLAGFCLPVCDCATVPVFVRMRRLHVPLSAAVTFLCAAPIINPVVVWSTWFAFPDRPWMAAARTGLGIVVALAVGASFVVADEPEELLESAAGHNHMNGLTRKVARKIEGDETHKDTCVHSQYGHHVDEAVKTDERVTAFHDDNHNTTAMSENHIEQCRSSAIPMAMPLTPADAGDSDGPHSFVAAKVRSVLTHAHDDLFRVAPYMLAGTLLASLIRTLTGSSPSTAWLKGGGMAAAVAAMMVLAFLASLCSTSDAVIARGLSGIFPVPSLLAFLLFGPIVDVKNVLMLSSSCTKRFVVRFVLTVAATCFLVACAAALVVGGSR